MPRSHTLSDNADIVALLRRDFVRLLKAAGWQEGDPNANRENHKTFQENLERRARDKKTRSQRERLGLEKWAVQILRSWIVEEYAYEHYFVFLAEVLREQPAEGENTEETRTAFSAKVGELAAPLSNPASRRKWLNEELQRFIQTRNGIRAFFGQKTSRDAFLNLVEKDLFYGRKPEAPACLSFIYETLLRRALSFNPSAEEEALRKWISGSIPSLVLEWLSSSKGGGKPDSEVSVSDLEVDDTSSPTMIDAAPIDDKGGPGQEADENRSYPRFHQFLEKTLTPDEKEIWELLYEEELTAEEAAVRLGKSPASVRKRHERFRDRLRGEILKDPQALEDSDVIRCAAAARGDCGLEKRSGGSKDSYSAGDPNDHPDRDENKKDTDVNGVERFGDRKLRKNKKS